MFTRTVCVTLPVSWRRCSSRWNLLVFHCVSTSSSLLVQAPGVMSMLQYLLCVCVCVCACVRACPWLSQLGPAVFCLSQAHLQIHLIVANAGEKCVALFDSDVYLKKWMAYNKCYIMFLTHFWQGITLWTACVWISFYCVYESIASGYWIPFA
jgi:hypothetical protein